MLPWFTNLMNDSTRFCKDEEEAIEADANAMDIFVEAATNVSLINYSY